MARSDIPTRIHLDSDEGGDTPGTFKFPVVTRPRTAIINTPQKQWAPEWVATR